MMIIKTRTCIKERDSDYDNINNNKIMIVVIQYNNTRTDTKIEIMKIINEKNRHIIKKRHPPFAFLDGHKRKQDGKNNPLSNF